jgi:hypothetical protein
MSGVWLARLLTDMIIMQSWSLELFVDHESAIAMSKNSVFHDRSKHARFHFIRDYIEEGRIKLSYTSSEKTCSHSQLGRVRFQELRDEIGIKCTSGRVQIKGEKC